MWMRRSTGGTDPDRWPKADAGKGSLDDYRFDLTPKNRNIIIRLAGSDPHQDVLAAAAEAVFLETAIGRRTDDEERTDAPMPIRLFADNRVIGPVGEVPRGLESVVSEAISRLEMSGRKPRIPVEVVRVRGALRVELLMSKTL